MRLPAKSAIFFPYPPSKLIHDIGKSPMKPIGNYIDSNGWNSPAGRHVVSKNCLLGSTMNEERPNPAGNLDVDIPGMDGWMDGTILPVWIPLNDWDPHFFGGNHGLVHFG